MAEFQREPSPALAVKALPLLIMPSDASRNRRRSPGGIDRQGSGRFAFQIAEVYAFRGESDKAFEWLDRAYAQRDSGLTQIKGDPLLKNIEHDLRYIAMLKRMRLPI